MATRTWWQRPQLRTDEDEHRERRVTWLELFYDLVFVVVVAEIAHYLSSHVSVEGVLGYILLFMAAWWMWIGGTFYNERFESEDLSFRLATFLQMIAVAAMAVFAYRGLDETSAAFALTYVFGRTIITLLWVRAGVFVPPFRPVAVRYAIGFGTSIVLFIISVFVPPPWRFLLWGAGLVIDLVTPMFTLRHQARLPRFSTSKLPERFGLFMIIVLGEAIVGAVRGVAEFAEENIVSFDVGVKGVLGLALAFGLWWVYFDFVARRQFKPGPWWRVAWVYFHLPLAMAIAAIGAGVLNLLTTEGAVVDAPTRWLLAGAVAVALVAITLLEWTLRETQDTQLNARTTYALKIGGAILALAIGLFGGGLGRIPFMALLFTPVLLQMLYGLYAWATTPTDLAEIVEPELA